MNTDEHRLIKTPTAPDASLTETVIGCAFAVSNTLGVGFLEKVYENALALELRALDLKVGQQVPMRVWYRDEVVGEYVADLIVNDRLLIELKHAREIDPIHVAQCLNYLRATKLTTCLLINFGKPKIEIKRLSL